MARSKHFLTYFWLRAERRWRQYRSQVCLSGELASLSRGCVFVDASKVDVTEWVNTIWGAALLDPDQSSPLTAEDDNPPPTHQTGARLTNQIHPPTQGSPPPAGLQLFITVNEDVGQWKREAQLPSPPREGEELEAFLGFN